MPTFDELALQSNCPVIHTQRSDKATLIATRVPIDDIRLEKWGWVLTLSPTDERTDQDDIETLRDNAGRKFPKVYLLKDMQNYIERWSCREWEEGYHNGHQAFIRSSAQPDADLLNEDKVKQLFSDLQEHQAKQVVTLMEEVKEQLETTRGKIAQDNSYFHQSLQDHTTDAYNRVLDRSRTNYEDITKQLKELDQEVDTQSVKVTQAIEAKLNLSSADTASHLEREHEEIKNDLAGFTTELKALEEQIKLALIALDPDMDEDEGKTENADQVPSATKLARKATTQIERITQSHQKMSMNYFNSANEQSRQGFKLAWSLVFTAIGLLVFTVISAVFMAILHLYGFAIVIGSIGTVGTSVVTVMGAISSFHAKTAEQFAIAQKLLDRSYRPTIANAMCIGYTNEDRKQAAIDKIIDGLLKNEATDIALK